MEKGLEGKAHFANIAATAKPVSLFGFAKLALDLIPPFLFLLMLRGLTQVSQTPLLSEVGVLQVDGGMQPAHWQPGIFVV